jgi:hypothetical protein
MKLALAIVATVALSGCSQGDGTHLPLVPDPSVSPGPAAKSLLMMVVDGHTSSCIVGATIQVVGGQRLGQSATQTMPCGAWDYGSEVLLTDLTPGVEMTVRASAPGYTSHEVSVVPQPQVVFFTLSRIPVPD